MYYTIKSILITVTDKNPPKQAERSIKKKEKKFYFISWLTSIERSSSAAILPIVILV